MSAHPAPAPAPSIPLHSGGPSCSRVVWGAWRLEEWALSTDDLVGLIGAAADLGLTTVDHADIYGDYGVEARFGQALAAAPGLRERLQLVTKCGIKLVSAARPEHRVKHYDTGRAHVTASVERSLENLRTDRVELLLLHRPDPFMDADETAEALVGLVEAGKVRAVGVSNFTPEGFDLLQSRLPFPLATNQVEASALHLQPFLDGTLDHAQRLRYAPMAWSPLGGGRLFHPDDAQAARVRAALDEVGGEIGASGPDQTALAWLLAHPCPLVPVVGTGRRERLEAAAGAAALRMGREQWFRIWTASQGAEVP